MEYAHRLTETLKQWCTFQLLQGLVYTLKLLSTSLRSFCRFRGNLSAAKYVVHDRGRFVLIDLVS